MDLLFGKAILKKESRPHFRVCVRPHEVDRVSTTSQDTALVRFQRRCVIGSIFAKAFSIPERNLNDKNFVKHFSLESVD